MPGVSVLAAWEGCRRRLATARRGAGPCALSLEPLIPCPYPQVRTKSYMNAILRNAHVFKGKTVLDVGCGTGILSLFAAKAGASHVYGIDMSAIAEHAKIIVKENNYAVGVCGREGGKGGRGGGGGRSTGRKGESRPGGGRGWGGFCRCCRQAACERGLPVLSPCRRNPRT